MIKNSEKRDGKKYYDWSTILKEKTYYNFIIGKHGKGKEYSILQRNNQRN